MITLYFPFLYLFPEYLGPIIKIRHDFYSSQKIPTNDMFVLYSKNHPGYLFVKDNCINASLLSTLVRTNKGFFALKTKANFFPFNFKPNTLLHFVLIILSPLACKTCYTILSLSLPLLFHAFNFSLLKSQDPFAGKIETLLEKLAKRKKRGILFLLAARGQLVNGTDPSVIMIPQVCI